MEMAIVEVTSRLDYKAIQKFNKFWRDHTSVKRFVVAGCLMFLPAAMFVFLAVIAEIWALLLLPFACTGFSVFCFIKYRQTKGNAIKIDKPRLRAWSPVWSPYLIGALVGLAMWGISDHEYYVYIGPALMLLGALIAVIAILKAKKNFKAIDHTCAFYESYLFFSYKALDMLVQKGIPYTLCYAQETNDAFYVQIPAERNGRRSAYPYYDSVIVEKEHLAPGQTETLRTLLAHAMGEKFKAMR